jgi:hypothetical protein
VTFLFTDIERSTEMWERYRSVMPGALERHDAVMRDVIAASGGRVFKEVGDAFHAVFADPAQAITSAIAIQRSLRAETWETPESIRVRIALHAGDAQERDGDFFGPTLNRTARILAAGHGGQILISQAVERRVEKSAKRRLLARPTSDRAVHDVEQCGQTEEPTRGLDMPHAEDDCRGNRTGRAERRDRVRMDASADEEVCDRVDDSQLSILQPVRQDLHQGAVWSNETRKGVGPRRKSKKPERGSGA